MCGITGFTKIYTDFSSQQKLWSETITTMRDSLTHRGPNDCGVFINQYACLGHRRLSIRDVTKGSQPMTRTFRNRTATIVFNGEIYNTSELIRIMVPFNINLETTGDTEVILYAYLTCGPSVFKYLNGIFAFCILENNQLILARDHLGVKPLYYYYDTEQFVFGSEQKSIFNYGIKPEINRNSLCEIFGLGPAHTPGTGVFKNIFELLPGEYLTVTNNTHNLNLQKEYFWKLEAKEHFDDYETTVSTTSFLIKDSVRRQLVSDVPVCSFLSGGLDSSLVSAICQDFMKLEGKSFHTFSFDFKDNNKNFKANNFQSSEDRPFVDIMVEHIRSTHHYLECTNEIQFDYLTKAVDARDLPCMADVESSLLYFCSEVAKTHNVAITGECADEIFGGYPWFHKKEYLNINSFPWSSDNTARKSLLKNDFLDFLNMDDYVIESYENSIAQTPHLYYEKDDSLKMRQISWLNIMWFMQTLLARMDRTSMYNSLETRVPFADYRILEYVYNVPWEYKARNNTPKNLLIEAGKEFLPPQVLYRKKSPYPKTYDPKYEILLGNHLLDIINNTNSKLNLICDADKIKKYINKNQDYGKPWYGQLMAGPQMMAYLIQVDYWLNKYNLTI